MESEQQQAPAQVRIERHYPCAVDQVWGAWTDPQALSRWFGTGKPGAVTQAEIDLRVGGHYRIVTRLPDGGTNDVSGQYQEVVQNSRLVFTWAWASTPERVSRVSIEFVARDAGTTLCFVHDRFFDDQARANHERGWSSLFEQLDAFVGHHTQEARHGA
jgi:uncharacterized protein YndB with AHSA1/START domain